MRNTGKCPCMTGRLLTGPRWRAKAGRCDPRLLAWAYPTSKRDAGPIPLPAVKTAGCNTASDLALSFANPRKTRYVIGWNKDRATLTLEPQTCPFIFPRIRGGPAGAYPSFPTGTPRRGKTALRLAVPLQGHNSLLVPIERINTDLSEWE